MNRAPIVPDGPLLVSILLPTLNRSHCLGKAVGSVLAQSYPNWELILSNNGRDPVSVLNPRARVIDSSAVTSAAYARNLALGSATGDLVCFLDDDDEAETKPGWPEPRLKITAIRLSDLNRSIVSWMTS